MIPGLLLAVREGLEAALILGILFGTLVKLDHLDQRRQIWLGAFTALLVSLFAGLALSLLGARLDGPGEAIFEGVTMISAAIILTWAIFWMRLQARTRNSSIAAGVKRAITQGGRFGLFGIAFLTVVREGVELSLFLIAAGLSAGNIPTLIGAAAGLAIAVVLGFALYSRMIRLDLKIFFLVSTVLLTIFAAGLVAHGIHEFNEVGFIPSLIEPVWNTGSLLADDSFTGQLLKTLVGYNADPSLSEMIGYFGYLLVVLLTLRRSSAERIREPSKSASSVN